MIPDDHIIASSVVSGYHGPRNARLQLMSSSGRSGAWSATYNNKNQWLQVDLGSLAVITKIATQGRQGHSQWVTNYTISYSLDGNDFHTYKNGKVLSRV